MSNRVTGAFALVVTVVGVVLLTGCGGGSGTTVTPKPLIPPGVQKDKAGIDPDELYKAGSDAQTNIRVISNGRYELTVQNTSNLGFINSFTWAPPPAMQVTAVATTGCQLAAGQIACSNIAIHPPKCTCLGGGVFTLTFSARTKAGSPASTSAKQLAGIFGHSLLVVRQTTPVPYKIPSYLGAVSAYSDLPVCKPGEQSTKAIPCVHSR